MHGRIFKLEELINDHVCGRCSLAPVLRDMDTSGVNGAERFARLNEEQQLNILGAKRFELYKNGIPLAEFARIRKNPVWGKEAALVSLKSLYEKFREKLPVLTLMRAALKDFTPTEEDLARFAQYVVQRGFIDENVKVKKTFQGFQFKNGFLGETSTSLQYHLFTRVVVDEQWANWIDEQEYLADLFSVVTSKSSRIGIYTRYDGNFISFINDNTIDETHLGRKSLSNVIVIFSLQRDAIISGYQFSLMSKIKLGDNIRWLR